jgi:hypothetical protein
MQYGIVLCLKLFYFSPSYFVRLSCGGSEFLNSTPEHFVDTDTRPPRRGEEARAMPRLKMETASSAEMLLTIYQTILPHILTL